MIRPNTLAPRLLTVLLSAWAFLSGVSCGPSRSEETVSVTLAISLKGGDGPAPLPGSSTSGSFGTSSFALNAYTDVSRIRVDVQDATTGVLWFSNFDLTKNALNQWTGTLLYLPKNKALVFLAVATKADGTQIFSGSTNQTLTASGQAVSIVLVPSNNGAFVQLPRVTQITVPRDLESDQTSNISFLVEANPGETLSDTVIADTAPGSGSFYPSSGTMTLTASSGTFVTQYSAPAVTTATDFLHSVKITNSTGNSVSTTFRVQVKPPGSTDGTRSTTLQVLFNPVFQTLASSRPEGSTDVLWEATVLDDKPESQLTYAWSFTPDGTYNPAPTITSTGNRQATLHGYTPGLTGVVTVSVTDSDGGTTTLRHTLPLNQYPDDTSTQVAPTGVNSLAIGSLHTCALLNDGSTRCWGNNASGQLGYGHALPLGHKAEARPSAAGPPPALERATHVATGGHHTCALLAMGVVRCWGSNTHGQLGYKTFWNGGDDETVDMLGYVNLGSVATKIAAGYGHSCALMDTGNLRCWGWNNHGQLGINSQQNIGDDELPTTDVLLGGLPVKDVVAGGYHTCALLQSGKVRCWGANDRGQLGIGNTTDVLSPATAPDVNLGTVSQLVAGQSHTCALLQAGNVRCWGAGGSGQLGYGNTNDLTTPGANISLGTTAIRIAAGDAHTCALLGNGSVKCWGAGGYGQLGQASTASLSTPPSTAVGMVGNATVYQLAAGGNHTCVLLSTGNVQCWGRNTDGQLGLGHTRGIGDDELPSTAGTVSLLPPAIGSPVITQTSQSSASVAADARVTLQVSASDPTALTFSWEASAGALSGVTTSATGSQITWTAPHCMPPNTTAAIFARVTNASGLITTYVFRVAVTASCSYLPSRCLQIRDNGLGVGDGLYTIDPDGAGGSDPMLAYCDMTHNGGGWTLAMMARSTTSTFNYSSAYWSSATTLNADVVDPNLDVDMKNDVFGKVPVSGVRLCLDSLTNCLADTRSATSAQALFSTSFVSAPFTRATYMAWDPTSDALFGNEPNCNVSGYYSSFRFVGCRFGLVMNNENDCGTTDAAIGFGCGSISAGAITFGNGTYPMRGWIFIQ